MELHAAGPALAWTGERYIPGEGGDALGLEHLHRYTVAAGSRLSGRVLDLGCGEGYGSAMLRRAGAETVVGVDISFEAVGHAVAAHAPFGPVGAQVDAMQLPFASDSFDAVVCFEVIEHVARPTSLLEEVRRVMSDGGVFFVSTPNKTVYDHEQTEPNPFHISEMELPEFEQLLRSAFSVVRLLGQRVVEASVMWPVGDDAIDSLGRIEFVERPTVPYVVAACSNEPLPDATWSVFTSWTAGSIEREAAARSHIATLEATIERLAPAPKDAGSERREAMARSYISELEATVDRLRAANVAAGEREAAAAAQLRRDEHELDALRARVADLLGD